MLLYSLSGILFGNSLLVYRLMLMASGVMAEVGTFFLKLAPELVLETSSIFFSRLHYSFFLNMFVLPGAMGFFYFESLESFFASIS